MSRSRAEKAREPTVPRKQRQASVFDAVDGTLLPAVSIRGSFVQVVLALQDFCPGIHSPPATEEELRQAQNLSLQKRSYSGPKTPQLDTQKTISTLQMRDWQSTKRCRIRISSKRSINMPLTSTVLCMVTDLNWTIEA